MEVLAVIDQVGGDRWLRHRTHAAAFSRSRLVGLSTSERRIAQCFHRAQAHSSTGLRPNTVGLVRALDRAAVMCTCPLGGGMGGDAGAPRDEPAPFQPAVIARRRLRLLGTGPPPPRVTGLHLPGITTSSDHAVTRCRRLLDAGSPADPGSRRRAPGLLLAGLFDYCGSAWTSIDGGRALPGFRLWDFPSAGRAGRQECPSIT